MTAQFDYTRARATAKRLIDRYGQAMTLRHVATGEYTAGAATQTTTDETVTGVTSNYSAFEQQNELVENTDRKVTIAALSLASPPAIDDRLLAGSEEGKIVNVAPIAPGSDVILYELQVRF